MEKLNSNVTLKKRLYAICAIAFAAIYALYVLGLEPLYESAVADVAVHDAVAYILDYACQILEHLAICIFYAVLIFCIYKLGVEQTRGLLWVFVAASLGKYLLKTAVSWYYNGAIPLKWYVDLIDVAYFVALEVLQLLIVRAFVKRVIAKGEKHGYDLSFVKLYDKTNPLLRATATSAVVIFAVRLSVTVINDLIDMLIGGLPEEPTTWILMIITYISTAVVGMLCYLAITLSLHLLCQRLGKES